MSSCCRSPVSIPQWCDCCLFYDFACKTPRRVSIPQWCDCCRTINFSNSQHNRSFNPTMVRLLPDSDTTATMRCCNVSIPQWCDCCVQAQVGQFVRQICFNPTMVRLLRRRGNRCRVAFFNFNPTMVRLLPKNSNSLLELVEISIPQWCDCCIFGTDTITLFLLFQSHNGAIAASRDVGHSTEQERISIPQWCDCCGLAPRRSARPRRFQSHNGAIAAGRGDRAFRLQAHFNPTMVRLLLRPRKHKFRPICRISIPQWCDCCANGAAGCCHCSGFQSHNGAIAAARARNLGHQKD